MNYIIIKESDPGEEAKILCLQAIKGGQRTRLEWTENPREAIAFIFEHRAKDAIKNLDIEGQIFEIEEK